MEIVFVEDTLLRVDECCRYEGGFVGHEDDTEMIVDQTDNLVAITKALHALLLISISLRHLGIPNSTPFSKNTIFIRNMIESVKRFFGLVKSPTQLVDRMHFEFRVMDGEETTDKPRKVILLYSN